MIKSICIMNRLLIIITITLSFNGVIFSQGKQTDYFVLNNNKSIDTIYWGKSDTDYIIKHFGEAKKTVTYSNIPNRKEGKFIKNVELSYSNLGLTFYLRSNPACSKSKAKKTEVMLDEVILESNRLQCLNHLICIGQTKEKVESTIGKGIESVVNGVQNNASVRYLELGLEIEYQKNKENELVMQKVFIYKPN